MELDHTIVHVSDKEASARFYTRVLGLEYRGASDTQSFVRVNDALLMRFDERKQTHAHYAFHVSDEEFDATLARVAEEGATYGSSARADDMAWADRDGGRRAYFKDPDGNSIEILTASQQI
ncbi:MAG: VOC family protein [Planctomycetota bacterium]|nr:VOC family protein [Planctomycetota bacterium]